MAGEIEFSILNIDKPSGPTSFDVSDFVRKLLGLRKTSHFGTLDPKVTGVLPIALNRACKLTGHFIGHDKEYVGIMRFHDKIDKKKVEGMIKEKFLGVIKQTPPVKSRVKRQEREREVKKFEILEQDGQDFVFHCEVQGGTYIRKLIDDLGKTLGVNAHMLELRRTRAGIFDESESVTLYELEDAVNKGKLNEILIDAKNALKKIYDFAEVKKEFVKDLLTGKPVRINMLKDKLKKDKGVLINIFSDEKFIGIYRITNEKEIFARPEFVLQPMK